MNILLNAFRLKKDISWTECACSILLRQPTGQRISKVRKQQKKKFNSANLMSIGKSGIIKCEFETT